MWIATIGAVRTDSAGVKKSSFTLDPLGRSGVIADAGTADTTASPSISWSLEVRMPEILPLVISRDCTLIPVRISPP